jgi:predicted component of viral defense system (DUF524 family)
MRVVLDTNVIISAMFFSGPPSRILSAWIEDRFELVLSPEGVRAAVGMNMKDPDRTFKNSDIVKMHAYRDALPSVQSAFVLYAGFVSRGYPALDGGLGGIDGVGAIALKPGGPPDDLRDHLGAAECAGRGGGAR